MIDLLTGLVIGLNVASVHVPAIDGQNNVNPGIYVRHESGWGGGAFRNTLKRTSVWAGYTFTHEPFSLTVGGITGYKWERITEHEVKGFSKHAVTLMVTPSAALPEVFGVVPRVSYMPKLGEATRSNTFHLSIERAF